MDIEAILTAGQSPWQSAFVKRPIEHYDASLWIARCSFRLRISKTSVSISGDTLTIIARIHPWRRERPSRPCRDQSRFPTPIDGNLTVEACIRHRSLPDSPRTRAPCCLRWTRQGYTSGSHSPFKFVNAAWLA